MTQAQALDILKMGKNVYLTGAPGSGKTYVLNQYISYLREREVPVVITASTGIAATHVGGMTIHSWSGLGIKEKLSEWDLDNMTQRKNLHQRFDKVRVLVIDEVSMLSADILDNVDLILRTFRKNDEPFGGIQVVLSGDLFQLPPISRDRTPRFIVEADVWQKLDVQVCYLSEQYRQEGGGLLELLGAIRSGSLDESIYMMLEGLEHKEFDEETPVTKLYTHNAAVDAVNIAELEKIKEDEETYYMESFGRKNLRDTLKRSCLAPDELRLRKGAWVMFVKNNFDKGYVNGTLGQVVGFQDGYPLVETHDGDEIVATPESWAINDDNKVLAEIVQVPLRLAWAITVHKSQGMTLDAAEMDLSKCFESGQGYVALSRVRSFDGLRLIGMNDMALYIDDKIRAIDGMLQNMTTRVRGRLGVTPQEKIDILHDAFVLAAGGTLDVDTIEGNRDRLTNKGKTKKKKVVRKSTHEQTAELVAKQLSIEEIAKERGLVTSTIVGHIVDMLDKGILSNNEVEYLQPKSKKQQEQLAEILDAAKDVKDGKLSPVRKALGNKYSFEEIKRAMIFREREGQE